MARRLDLILVQIYTFLHPKVAECASLIILDIYALLNFVVLIINFRVFKMIVSAIGSQHLIFLVSL
jgi:hypothetical protein